LTRSISIFFFLIFIHCAFAGKKPLSINEAITYFEKKWSDKQKESFKNLPEEKAVSESDLTHGIFIRSKWLYNNKDTALLNEFLRMGVDEAHDMSRIIITSLHRKLNKLPIDIEGQVNDIKNYWKPIRACEAVADKLAEENFKKFKVGDSIFIYMDVDAKFGTRNAILHQCPDTEWSFDYKNDLLIKGIVLDKYSNASKKNVSLKIKIAHLSSENTTVLFKKVKPSDEMEFYLRYLLVKGKN
jgi:hypothetical protein